MKISLKAGSSITDAISIDSGSGLMTSEGTGEDVMRRFKSHLKRRTTLELKRELTFLITSLLMRMSFSAHSSPAQSTVSVPRFRETGLVKGATSPARSLQHSSMRRRASGFDSGADGRQVEM